MLNYIGKKFCTSKANSILTKSNLQILYEVSKKNKTPFFTIQSHLVQIIDDPLQFYLALHNESKKAINRIGLSSLYLGTGSLERHLLNLIIKRSKSVPTLDVTMIFDYNRSLRPQHGESPVEMMNYYLDDQLKKRISVSFHRQSYSNFKMFGQISGVHHQKIALFDDTIIIGGANLSQNYFLNRRDRYLKFRECTQMADYFYDYLKIMSQNGYQLGQKPVQSKNANLTNHLRLWKFSNTPEQYKQTLNQQQQYLKKLKDQKYFQSQRTVQGQLRKPVPKNNNVILSQMLGSDVKVYQQMESKERMAKIEGTREKLFNVSDENDVGNHLIEIQNIRSGQDITQVGEKVYIFPIIQFPKLGQKFQHNLLKQLLQNSVQNNIQVKISSGYLNLTKDILQVLSKSKIPTEILCSSPQANSFYRGGMFKKYIPYFYRNFQGLILQKWPGKFRIKEYFDSKWSFHAKGLWVKQNQNNYLTVVGSSNYNQRSKQRDTQLQLYIYSTCPRLNYRLDKEWKFIQKDCKQVTVQNIKQDKQIKYNIFFKLLSKLFSRHL